MQKCKYVNIGYDNLIKYVNLSALLRVCLYK